jgi:eukaryotic-like serine/threonine-protein kinase
MAEPRVQPSPNTHESQDLSGTSVGRYEIRERLGAGGMGEVYRAEDAMLRRAVALKRIVSRYSTSERYRRRFLYEARCASRLNEPHIASVYDVVEKGDEAFLVMEYVEGETLREREKRPVKTEEFFSIAEQCATALAAAHKERIIHGDIKPENIMLTKSGQVKILDFGVAKVLPGQDETVTLEASQTGAGPLGGTPSYMAPEVLLEKDVDGRADIFSLGVVFYEILAEAHPFHAHSFVATSQRILHAQPPDLRGLNRNIPVALEHIISKMLSKDREERYATAADLAVDLRGVRLGVTEGEPQPKTRDRRSKLRTAMAAAILLAFAGSGYLGLRSYRHSRAPLLGAKDRLLVADFDNRSGEPLFEEGVQQLLLLGLEQSRYVHVVPRSQVVDAARRMGKIDLTRLDADTGQEICTRENYRAMVAGQINRTRHGFDISIEVIDPRRGQAVLREQASLNSPDELYTTMDGLTLKLRAKLGESLAQIDKESEPLAKVTTPSLVALERYSRAMDHYATGDTEGFLALAKSAVEVDPQFAMAHLYLGLTYDQLGNESEAERNLEAAVQGIERVSERERYLILASKYAYEGMYEKAAAEFRQLTEVYPDDIGGYRGLAEMAVWTGRPEDGVTAEERAIALDPNESINYLNLMLDLVRVNRFSDALETYGRARKLGITSSQLHWGAGLAYLGEGNSEDARKQFAALGSEGGQYEENLSALFRARVEMYEGHLREAEEQLKEGIVLDQKMHSESWIPVRMYLLWDVLDLRGARMGRAAQSRRLAGLVKNRDEPEDLRRAGLVAVRSGDLATGRGMLGKLSELASQRQSGYTLSCYYNLKGAVELAAGQTAEAEMSENRAALYFPSFQAYAALGDIYTEEKDWEKAAPAYSKYLEFKGQIFSDDSPAEWALAHLKLARALARMGNRAAALESYENFFQLWNHADGNLQVLSKARAEEQKLRSGISVVPGPRSSQGRLKLSTEDKNARI